MLELNSKLNELLNELQNGYEWENVGIKESYTLSNDDHKKVHYLPKRIGKTQISHYLDNLNENGVIEIDLGNGFVKRVFGIERNEKIGWCGKEVKVELSKAKEAINCNRSCSSFILATSKREGKI